MKKIVNEFLLSGDKFMLERYLREPEFKYISVDHFQKKTKKECRNIKKQNIKDVFIKTN